MRHSVLFALLTSGLVLTGQTPAPADLLKQGQQRIREGNRDAALDLFQQAVAADPNSYAAHTAMGTLLDILGRYSDAREHLERAVSLAKPAEKPRAMRNLAMSYAFERNCDGAAKYLVPVFEDYRKAGDAYMTGEIANELARVCIESGQLDTAEKWYLRGREEGLKEADIKPDRKDLWEFRTEHALARLAALRGQKPEAERHVTAAKAIFDRGTNPAQAPFVHYLTGYVALKTGDAKTALVDLAKGNQQDVFIQLLMAEAHEKTGNPAAAMELYRKIAQANGHNPPAAFAIPVARKKLGL